MKIRVLICVILITTIFQPKYSTAMIQKLQIPYVAKPIVVAIIDTGTDIKHKSLTQSIWKNPGESGFDKNGRDKSNNGIDDDLNGYIDDIHGWNFTQNNNNVQDSHGHGTHIAGIISGNSSFHYAKENSPIAPQLMILKYFDSKSSQDNLKFIVQSINYAIKMKADIINFSGGGSEPSLEEYQALKTASEKKISIVVAAGNDGQDSAHHGFFPAHYNIQDIISVSASDSKDRVIKSSNWGEHVTLIAEGKDIISTLPQNKFGKMTGTSQATAVVTGLLARIKNRQNKLSTKDLVLYIVKTGDFKSGWMGKAKFPFKLNAEAALNETRF